MAMSIRADSTEYVTATLTADHDISGSPIEIATPLAGEQPTVWTVATVLGVVQNGANWTATYRILMGPNAGDIALAAGSYVWFVRVTDSPERPVRQVGPFTVV